MLERITEIVKEQLNMQDVTITAQTSFEKDLEVDSLDLFELVMALEEQFDIEIPSQDLEPLTTVGAVVEYLKNKGAE